MQSPDGPRRFVRPPSGGHRENGKDRPEGGRLEPGMAPRGCGARGNAAVPSGAPGSGDGGAVRVGERLENGENAAGVAEKRGVVRRGEGKWGPGSGRGRKIGSAERRRFGEITDRAAPGSRIGRSGERRAGSGGTSAESCGGAAGKHGAANRERRGYRRLRAAGKSGGGMRVAVRAGRAHALLSLSFPRSAAP